MTSAPAAPTGWQASALSGGWLYRPIDLPPGSDFTVWLPKPVALSPSLSGAQAMETLRRDGLTGLPSTSEAPSCNAPTELARQTLSQACSIGTGARRISLQYVLLPASAAGGQAHWLRVMAMGDPALLERYQPGFREVMGHLTTRWSADVASRGTAGGTANAKSSSTDARSGTSTAKPDADPEKAIRTAPGKGVPTSQIDTIYFSWDQVYRGMFYMYEETIYLLLKDGTGFEELEIPPDELDLAQARRLLPSRIVQWRRSGKTYEVKGPEDKTWRALKGQPAIPGERNQRLAQTFVNSWFSSSGLTGGSTRKTSFIFKPDGRYEIQTFATSGTGSLQANNGFVAGSVSTGSARGTESVSSVSATGGQPMDLPVVAGGSRARRDDGAKYTGRYRIDGWTLELTNDLGEVERRLFLFTDDKRDALNIGGKDYSIPQK